MVYFGGTMEEEDLNKQDRLKERIKFELEVVRLSVVIGAMDLGGIVSLIINKPKSGAEFFFLTMGLIVLIAAVVVGLRNLLNLLKKIQSMERYYDLITWVIAIISGLGTALVSIYVAWVLMTYEKRNQNRSHKTGVPSRDVVKQ